MQDIISVVILIAIAFAVLVWILRTSNDNQQQLLTNTNTNVPSTFLCTNPQGANSFVFQQTAQQDRPSFQEHQLGPTGTANLPCMTS